MYHLYILVKEGSMLAYAPRRDRARPSPTALTLIVGIHAVAILAVMNAKLEIVPKDVVPTIVDFIPDEQPPEPVKPQPRMPNPAPDPPIAAPTPIVPMPPLPGPEADPLPQQPIPPGPVPGTGADPLPPKPLPIVRTGPRFTTPAEDIRPPYPEALRAQEKEAVLRLRLSIDERGRVVAVEAVGKTEPAFLAAARRHILKAWRYKPAMEGDRPIASTTVVTLEFRLDS